MATERRDRHRARAPTGPPCPMAACRSTEFAAERPGPLSPFGEDVEFPLPPDKVAYVHPSAADRPRLAGDPYSWD